MFPLVRGIFYSVMFFLRGGYFVLCNGVLNVLSKGLPKRLPWIALVLSLRLFFGGMTNLLILFAVWSFFGGSLVCFLLFYLFWAFIRFKFARFPWRSSSLTPPNCILLLLSANTGITFHDSSRLTTHTELDSGNPRAPKSGWIMFI